MKVILLPIVICPNCRSRLEGFKCSKCGRFVGNLGDDGIFNFLPDKLNSWKKQEEEFHNTESENYDELNCLDTPRNKRIHNQFLDWIRADYFEKCDKNKKNEENFEYKIIEIGGGTGNDAEKIVNLQNTEIVISDLAKGALQIGKSRFINKENIAFCQIDAENIPFDDNVFDCVYCVAALHHLEFPEKFLMEAKRILKLNGNLIIGVEPNRYGHVMWQNLIFGLRKLLKKKKVSEKKEFKVVSIGDEKTEGFSRKEIKRLLLRAEFGNIKIKPVWFLTGFYHTFAQKIKWLDRAIFDYILMLVDIIIENIPFLNNLCWHWNIKAKAKK